MVVLMCLFLLSFKFIAINCGKCGPLCVAIDQAFSVLHQIEWQCTSVHLHEMIDSSLFLILFLVHTIAYRYTISFIICNIRLLLLSVSISKSTLLAYNLENFLVETFLLIKYYCTLFCNGAKMRIVQLPSVNAKKKIDLQAQILRRPF